MDEFRAFLRGRLSQRGDIARLAKQSGVHPVVIGRWLTGTRPTTGNLDAVAPHLGVSPRELMRMAGYPVESDGGAFNPEEALILSEYRTLSEDVKEAARQAVLALLRGFGRTNVQWECNVRAVSPPRQAALAA